MDWWKCKESLEAVSDLIFAKGLLMEKGDHVVRLAVTLQPSLFPVEYFDLAVRVQSPLNSVLDAVSRDLPLMNKIFKRIADQDPFVRGLFEIFQEVQRQGNVQTTTFGIHRSDYLIDKSPTDCSITMKQVEINTIASGLVAHSVLMSNLHKYIISRYIESDVLVEGKVLDNETLPKISNALAVAYKEYRNPNAYVLFVVQGVEWNIFDQRHFEYYLWERYSIPVIRRTLTQLAEQSQLTESRKLFVEGKEIAVIYYRAGYGPKDYPTDREWEARRMLELSRASNCPSVAYQLIGSKKIQQVLSEDGFLEKYCSDATAVSEMRSTFTHQYSLEMNSEGDKAVQLALKNPEKYVLKPQREGGGNNLYEEDLRSMLSSVANSPEREAYIVMDRINSPSFNNAVLQSDGKTVQELSVMSELGIFGVFVRRGDEVLVNDDAGYVQRCKPASVNEGGMSIGVGCIDCPWLVSSEAYIESFSRD